MMPFVFMLSKLCDFEHLSLFFILKMRSFRHFCHFLGENLRFL